MPSYIVFDIFIGILALQGLIADILLIFGIVFVIWTCIADWRSNKKNKQMEASEYEGLKQALFEEIDLKFRENDEGDGEPARC